MIPQPMEERLSSEWGLKSEREIKARIFEEFKHTDKLTHVLSAEKLVVCSFALGKILASYNVGLKASQLRRFYESLLNLKAVAGRIRVEADPEKAFKAKVIPQVLMLKPQLANARARQQREVTPFYEVINLLLDLVKDGEDYERLCDFVQAVVAYHKYCGGRD